MLDFRINTFIDLCKTMSYTKTAENLFITQPAVTHHIKFLEEFYNCCLFNYSNRTLTLTESGKCLYKHLLTMNSDQLKIKKEISEKNCEDKNLYFGATLTVGEYVVPEILLKFSKKYPATNIRVVIKDTAELLQELKNGNIEFAIVEGFFEKTDYESIVYSKENFIGVCSPENKLAQKNISFQDLLKERIILREAGSGSRDIFEKILYNNNLSIKDFEKKYEVSNIQLIKKSVKNNCGITFIYEKAVIEELKAKELVKINLNNFKTEREFNFIFMKNSIHSPEYREWFAFLKD